jgi:hypothetical protein
MIDGLIEVIQFIGSAISALFNVLDVLNAIYSLGQFVYWCVQTVAELIRDILMRRS